MSLFDGLFIASSILFILFVFTWLNFNSFIKKLNQVREDFSDIDIQLKRRADLIDQLVGVVKGYAKHEKDIFVKVAKVRSNLNQSKTIKDFEKADNSYSSVLKNILFVVESYPQLKADQSFKQLMDNFKETEDRIALHREIYNQTVKKYNSSIQTFPNFILAEIFNFQLADFFEYTNEI
jgi:LemA protein